MKRRERRLGRGRPKGTVVPIDRDGRPRKNSDGSVTVSKRSIGRAAGLSERQIVTALRIASISLHSRSVAEATGRLAETKPKGIGMVRWRGGVVHWRDIVSLLEWARTTPAEFDEVWKDAPRRARREFMKGKKIVQRHQKKMHRWVTRHKKRAEI